MKKYIYNIIVIILIVIVVISAFIGGMYFAGGFKPKTVTNGIILDNGNYDSTFIRTYDEYVKLLNNHDIKDIVLFTNNDFKDKDYIVDYINYDENLVIDNIDVIVLEDGLKLTYTVNKKVNNNKNTLMYFIPVDKDTLSITNIKTRDFIEK